MKKKICFLLSFVLLAIVLGVGPACAEFIWCTEYVASEFGIKAYPDAKNWWTDSRISDAGYTHHSSPSIGAIIVFNSWGSNIYGHVGIVTEVESSDRIVIAHSNWNWDGQILTDIEVDDVSDNWTSVKVYNPRIGGFGSKSFPVRGFLYPPEGTPNPITLNHSLFESLCIDTVPYDSRCDGTDIDNWLECRDVYGGNFDLCWGNGIGGGDYETSLPDFIVHNIWLENQLGKIKTVFRPGEQIRIKAKIKNTGNGDSPSEIEIGFYRSDGYNVDSDKQRVSTAHIDADDLESGETETEEEIIYAPQTPGIYNITAYADTDEEVEEEHERNNRSDEAVFRVDDFSWLVPIIKRILN